MSKSIARMALQWSFILCCLAGTSFADYDSGRAELSLSVNNEIYPYSEFATFVLPNEHLGLCLLAYDPSIYRVSAASGDIDFIGDCRWIWTADGESGLTRISVTRETQEIMALNVFVMTPATELRDGRLGNVTIGEYPPAIDDSPIYLPPDGFIRVTEANLATPVSPNFVLGQFVTELDSEFPKYIVLRERLLLKLEALLERLNERGIAAESLSVLSGYMTPDYNRSLGGNPHSRHIYGGAATIIVDRDADGRMDDLDGNGVLDNRDGQFLFDLIDELYSEQGKEYLRGGLFLYRGDAGPAVMLDARGFRKRWANEAEAPPIPENLRAKHKREF